MNGYTLSMIAEKTGININKLKAIVARDKTVREMPYSVKSGGSRIFFDDFVTWLKHYEGIDVAELHKLQTSNQRNQSSKLPSGAQITAMLKVYGAKDMAKRLDFVLGYKEPVLTIAPRPVQAPLGLEEPRATPEQIAEAFGQVVRR